MRVLIVDDDDNKRRQLCRAVNDTVATPEITEGRSYQGALRARIAGNFELILLDMTMPTFDVASDDDGGRTQAYAGRELLRQMDARGVRTPTIVVTQYEQFGGEAGLTLSELNTQLATLHPEVYVGSIFFDITTAKWRRELDALIRKAVRGKR
jgi:CheY-like chemotaxis protein